MTALALLEHARFPVYVLWAVVPLMLDNAARREASPAKFAFGVLRGRRRHFQLADIRLPSFVSAD
jgi:hypothetical protein